MRKYWPAVVLIVAAMALPSRATAQDTQQQGAAKMASAEAAVGTSVENRTLAGTADTFKADVGKLYCFSRVENAADSDIQHVWYQNDQEVARVTLHVGGSPWRTHSTKTLPANAAGDWRCDVVQGETVLQSVKFKIEP